MRARDVAVSADGPLPILVGIDSATGRVAADALPSKGTRHAYNADQAARQVFATGHTRIIYKSDDEPSIVALKRESASTLRES